MLDNQISTTRDQIAAAPATQAPVPSTNNWDTAFAVDFAAVNDGIAAQGNFPEKLDHSQSAGDETARIEGDYKPWRLIGGSGHLLTMRLPLKSFTLTRTDGDEETSETRENAWADIQLTLYAVEGPIGSASDGGTPVAFRANRPDSGAPNASEYSVKVTAFSWTGFDPEDPEDDDLAEICKILVADNFRDQAKIDEFDHTFVTVNLNCRIGTGDSDLSWIAPTAVSYGVLANDAPGGGSFAVLCMTGGRTPPTNHNVHPGLVGTARAGFLIDKPLFLDRMIKPGIATMFGRTPDDTTFIDQNFSVDGNVITNTAELSIPNFQVKKDVVTARVPKRQFSIAMEDTFLTIDFGELHHPYGKVIKYMYEAHHQLKINADARLDEKKIFRLTPISDASGEDAVTWTAQLEKSDFAKTVDIALLIADIVGLLATIFKGISVVRTAANGATLTANVSGGTAEAAGFFSRASSAAKSLVQSAKVSITNFVQAHPYVILVGIGAGVAGVTMQVAKGIFEDDRESDPRLINPDMQDFALKVLSPVKWPDGSGLTVENVAFNGGFHITGTPDFTHAPEDVR